MWDFAAWQESHACSVPFWLLFGCSLFLMFSASLIETYGLGSHQMLKNETVRLTNLSCFSTQSPNEIDHEHEHFCLIRFQWCTTGCFQLSEQWEEVTDNIPPNHVQLTFSSLKCVLLEQNHTLKFPHMFIHYTWVFKMMLWQKQSFA